jgi:predicted Rossmann fold nucleotide-binding protein DprA/Smf involved in DNA uptake
MNSINILNGKLVRSHLSQNSSCYGNEHLLSMPLVAFFSSFKCSAEKILATYEQCKKWSTERQPIISGFHSPVEKECLRILLRKKSPVIISPARGLWKRNPRGWQDAIQENRLLIVSIFPREFTWMNSDRAMQRNRFICDVVDEITVSYLLKDGKMERFFQKYPECQGKVRYL